ncbi:MAG TPA: hypothetical protein DDY14_10710 [Chromatiaceae bacterium]|jgi:hypothetical protein|nr:MAG: hypothetical protein N838_00465 [Thiohalocapsa sp. PB-PSB1]QQO57362.1 MAG: hypothetical protein N838_32435 [Thiohalocapsa sp. PB-PSB1]HBG95764.1 hypothetical protein [Chromatiaceae bacterium]HCS88832.1 hypothetical protein [Chromatiaceae bacterium]
MMPDAIDLYALLPEVYRREDARRGYPLKALLSIISEQATVVKEDIDRLWDNFFVETADDWVLPYLGDLIGNIPIHAVVRGRRADIAKTISYRLRKGTLPMLEELARDVTGWSVHAVAFFDMLTWTQNTNHLRRNVGTLPVRDIDRCDRVHTAFDAASHTLDIRPFAPAAGWHHIPKVGFFIWRLSSYELRDVQPRPADENSFGYLFNPLGIRQHLFHSPVAESDDTGLASEIHIAQPIRRIAFHAAPETYFGDDKSVGIRIDNTAQTATDIVCMDLSQWRQRTDGKIGVDIINGRLSLPPALVGEDIAVSLHYGFSADVGGGTYERRDDPTVRDPQKWALTNPDEPGLVLQVPGDHDTLQAALTAWNPEDHPRLLIQIVDSRTYTETLTFNQNTFNRENVQIIVQAENKQRPMIIGDLIVPDTDNPARLSLKGLLIEGQIQVATPEDLTVNTGLDLLEVMHSTLVPGILLSENASPLQPETPSIVVAADNDRLDVMVDHSIVGPLRLPPDTRSLRIYDSIVDNLAAIEMGQVYPALASGDLNLTDAEAAVGKPLTVRIGNETHTVSLTDTPTSLDEIASGLQMALRSAPGATRAFTEAPVLRLNGIPRAIILQNTQRRIRIEDGEAAGLLGVNPANASDLSVFVGATVGDFGILTQPPQLTVFKETVSDDSLGMETFTVALSAVPADGNTAASDLETLLRARAELGTNTFVRFDQGHLVVYSMQDGVTLRFAATGTDPLGVVVLGLLSTLPAIGYDAVGILPAPECYIENSTIMGAVSVRAMQTASNSIFTDTVTVQRQQIGCVRFSYVPPASVTPRRFRCEPDRAMDAAVQNGMDDFESLIARQEAGRRVRPQFTTRRYGLPAYVQLSQDCAREIRTGADNAAEMGVFNRLMRPQREANLRIRFQEYLPFGLEYGLIYVN